MTLDEAKDIVSKFQEAMARANAAIRENPHRNNYTVYNKTDIQDAAKPAPYLTYDSGTNISSDATRRLRHRVVYNDTAPTNSSGLSYTIPPEVVEAARLVAEAHPPDASADEYDAVVARMKEKYAPKNNDTNAMPQVLQAPSGLLEFVGNATGTNTTTKSASASSATAKRAAADFWMENISQSGSSPFAPAGYKVWRNVKDYGAKGSYILLATSLGATIHAMPC